MKAATVGHTVATAGQLLALYAVEETGEPTGNSRTLYVLKDFNLSEELARYQERLIAENRLQKTDETVTTLAQHLVERGFVSLPEATAVCLGQKNRLPERLSSEYKHYTSKAHPVLYDLIEHFTAYSLSVLTDKGRYLILGVGFNSTGKKLSAEVWHEGEYIGMLKLDTVGDESNTDLDDSEREKIRQQLIKQVEIECQHAIEVKSIFYTDVSEEVHG